LGPLTALENRNQKKLNIRERREQEEIKMERRKSVMKDLYQVAEDVVK
jgi:hypothetical protein